ncbi:hypothetical protein Hsar01_03564 [Haloferula sargassicola]|uniref:Uncharacterized protein n=1 Tax=Haloferula sargassicola TaxID=490096 RepID=A0ABP9UVA7_9BACT
MGFRDFGSHRPATVPAAAGLHPRSTISHPRSKIFTTPDIRDHSRRFAVPRFPHPKRWPPRRRPFRRGKTGLQPWSACGCRPGRRGGVLAQTKPFIDMNTNNTSNRSRPVGKKADDIRNAWNALAAEASFSGKSLGDLDAAIAAFKAKVDALEEAKKAVSAAVLVKNQGMSELSEFFVTVTMGTANGRESVDGLRERGWKRRKDRNGRNLNPSIGALASAGANPCFTPRPAPRPPAEAAADLPRFAATAPRHHRFLAPRPPSVRMATSAARVFR